jgi:hypothetical protein
VAAGSEAGTLHIGGYRVIRIDGSATALIGSRGSIFMASTPAEKSITKTKIRRIIVSLICANAPARKTLAMWPDAAIGQVSKASIATAASGEQKSPPTAGGFKSEFILLRRRLPTLMMKPRAFIMGNLPERTRK